MNATNTNSQLDAQHPDSWLAHVTPEELAECDAHVGAMQAGDFNTQMESE
tara:strand:- start:2712 stop:2861 length:150 start_codon:yes stop_codon:yes gene_type:complete